MFQNIYGLSCVENQVLLALKQSGCDIAHFYNGSAIPLKRLFSHLVKKGQLLQDFDGLPRVQDVAKKLGIISLVLHKEDSADEARGKLHNLQENEFLLMRVNREFTKGILRARGWRSDHFVRLSLHENKFLVQNDIPEKSVAVSGEQLAYIYDGEYFLLNIVRDISEEDSLILKNHRIYEAEEHVPYCFMECELEEIPDIGKRLMGMTAVYKTLRERLFEYYGQFCDTGFILDYLPLIEKYMARFEYLNLRKIQGISPYYNTLSELNGVEMNIMNTLKLRLRMKGF